MSVDENDWDAIDLQNKIDFFSDAWKEVYGSRPGRINYDWFKSLTNEDREAELQGLCDAINHNTDLEIQEEEETVKDLQQYGDFTKEQLEKWDCL